MKLVIIFFAIIFLVSGALVKKWHKNDDGSMYFIEHEQKVFTVLMIIFTQLGYVSVKI